MDTAQFNHQGYTVLNDIFSPQEVVTLVRAIGEASSSGSTFRKTADLFAIRQFLKEVPQIHPTVFNATLKLLIRNHFGPDYFVVKSIYFDKPEASNWFVAWHQDLTISVDRKVALPGFSNWTIKQDQFSVQPPLPFLENIVTIRIHLDDTDEHNGALRVIPGSHSNGISRYNAGDVHTVAICRVKKGGVMFMRPLLQHASNRTTNGSRRRVIHIELSNLPLPAGLDWAEAFEKGHFSNDSKVDEND